MGNILAWLDGKKSYITAFVLAVLGLLTGVFGIQIPDFVYQILGAFGIVAAKSAIAKVE